MDFWDLNKACPKDNFLMPFIDQILDECAGREIFSFMDGFSGYNQIEIHQRTSTRQPLYVPREPLLIRRFPLVLKMLVLHSSGP
jgi:hypothetical protein